MRIIITGGTGLIGQALATSLANDQHEIIILSRNPNRSSTPPGSKISYVQWDGRSAKGWGHLADGADVIVNLAGESIAAGRWTDERKERIINSRLHAGLAIVQAVESATRKPAVVMQASAVGFYGPHQDDTLTESAPAGNDFLSQVCIRSEGSIAHVEQYGVRRVYLRTGVVLDTHHGALPPLLLPFRFFVGGPIGDGKQWFPWIHIDDEIAAIRFLIDQPDAVGPYNLCAPEPLTNAQFARIIGKVWKRPSIIPIPAFIFQLLFGEMSTVLLDGQKTLPQRLSEKGFSFKFPTAEEALRDLLMKKDS